MLEIPYYAILTRKSQAASESSYVNKGSEEERK